ncbi:uncharacterized protein LOC144115129 [Amblyomma americanum]
MEFDDWWQNVLTLHFITGAILIRLLESESSSCLLSQYSRAERFLSNTLDNWWRHLCTFFELKLLTFPPKHFENGGVQRAAFYGTCRRGDKPRVSDETAEAVLQRIAQANTSDIDLSDSDDDTIVDPNFSAPLEDEGTDETSDDEGPSTSGTGRAEKTWKRHQGEITTWIPDFGDNIDSSEQRCSWAPIDYFVQYIPNEVHEKMALAMNRSYVEMTGKSLQTSAEELKTFFAISLTMSCLCYPQIRMYWQKKNTSTTSCSRQHVQRSIF